MGQLKNISPLKKTPDNTMAKLQQKDNNNLLHISLKTGQE